ncbi:MAG: porin [Gammaproteobacteria bacterium]
MQKLPNRALLSAAVAAAVAALAAPAQAIDVKLSGQINRAVTLADNGTNTDALFVDNNNTGTRFRLRGGGEIGGGVEAGVRWETQYNENSSSVIDIGDGDGGNSDGFVSRYREVWFKGNWGQVYLGQGDGAANGTSEVDLSGTAYVADYSGQNLDDGLQFALADGSGTRETSNGAVFSNFDGLSRNDRLRYDTPTWGGLVLSGDVGQDKWEVAGRYKAKWTGGQFGAAAGYVGREADAFGTQLGVSASILLNNGINLSGSYGQQDPDNADAEADGFYAKIGYKFGADQAHAVSVSYNVINDLELLNDEATRIAGAYVYNIKEHGVELYGLIQNAELDRPGVDIDDVGQISIGSRIKF